MTNDQIPHLTDLLKELEGNSTTQSTDSDMVNISTLLKQIESADKIMDMLETKTTGLMEKMDSLMKSVEGEMQ